MKFVLEGLQGIGSYKQRLSFKMRRSAHLVNPAVLLRMLRGIDADEVIRAFLAKEINSVFTGVAASQVELRKPDSGHRSMLRIASAGDQRAIIRVYPPK